jgi:hypothetical protein
MKVLPPCPGHAYGATEGEENTSPGLGEEPQGGASRAYWVPRAFLSALALCSVLAAGCSSNPTGNENAPDEDCETIGLLTVCGADTTRVDTTGTGGM